MHVDDLLAHQMTRAERTIALLARADDLLPELAERRQEIDHCRSMPQDLADTMAGLGFYRLCAPTGAGGLDVGVRGMAEVVERLATVNGSAAWCAFIASTSQLNVAASHPTFVAEVTIDPATIFAGVFSPSGTAIASERDGDSGYSVTGHWRWGSGCRNAAWISGALHEVGGDGEAVPDSPLSVVWFRPDELEIADNWHVSGLRGTGSSDFIATDVWVPAERAVGSPFKSPFGDEPVFRFPLFGVLGTPIGAIALGMAQASIDEVLREARTKTPQGSRRTLAERPLLHRDLATAQTRLHAARALFYSAIDEVWATALEGRTSLTDRVSVRTATCHAVNTAVEVVDRMYAAMGGTSVFETSPLQQHFRDVHVATQHMMVADSVMELAGRVMVGIDDTGAGL